MVVKLVISGTRRDQDGDDKEGTDLSLLVTVVGSGLSSTDVVIPRTDG